MPRFVLLLHNTPPLYARGTHYDLMLEHGEMLRTWALEALPVPGTTVSAEQLPDHRPIYLDYEGEVAGERGAVSRVDRGDYCVVEESAGQLVVKISGSMLRGTLTIGPDEAAHRWQVSLSSG